MGELERKGLANKVKGGGEGFTSRESLDITYPAIRSSILMLPHCPPFKESRPGSGENAVLQSRPSFRVMQCWPFDTDIKEYFF